METNPKKPSGLLNVNSILDKLTLTLHTPSPDIGVFIEHYWIVNWDFRGQEPYLSENLPHPSVHLVIEHDQSRIVGIVKEKFSILLKEKGFVFGVKFHPGSFYPFVNIPVYKFTGREIPTQNVLGADITKLEDTILSMDDQTDMVQLAESFIRKRLPEQDDTVSLVQNIVGSVMTDQKITKVEHIANQFNLTVRMLQRIFSKYVGIGPKWVIQRYRMLELADQLANGHPQSWPQLAIELGYYDQSHFIKDFKSIVGLSPEEYVKKNEYS
jgi:AraC-like DNA-binding protein